MDRLIVDPKGHRKRMPVLSAMRKRKARRVGEAVGRSVHDFGNHRQRAYRPRTDTWNEQQFGEVDRRPIRCGSQIGVKARRQHVACPDIVMGRHHQMRQRKLRRNGWCDRSFNPARQSRQFARNAVWTHGVQHYKLTAARAPSTVIGEIDDLTLPDSIDGGVGLLDKTFQAFGKPVVPASLFAVAIRSLLDYDPLAIIGHDESVQIEIKAILHGGATDLDAEPACVRERRTVKAHTLPDCYELPRRLPGMFAAAAALFTSRCSSPTVMLPQRSVLPGYVIQHFEGAMDDYQHGVMAGMNDNVERLTGQMPMSVGEFTRSIGSTCLCLPSVV